ncbi:TldD/PmbA family protein [Rhodococcus hoagii]|nr:TldD/PmbA family protein [Prescottella equi]
MIVTHGGARHSDRAPHAVDDEFTALPLRALADAALAVARAAGAEHADLRVHRTVTQSLRLRDGRVQAVEDGTETGFAVRVIVDGTWGFASHAAVDVGHCGRRGGRSGPGRPCAPRSQPRTGGARTGTDPSRCRVGLGLRDGPVHRGDGDDKVALLGDWSRRLLGADGVDHVTASCLQVKEQTFYADLAGSTITQQRVRLHPELEATSVDSDAGTFETMRTLAPPVGRAGSTSPVRGGSGTPNWPRSPVCSRKRSRAPSVEAGPTDLVIDPTNLWLTIHESVGHATEYDRAIGYEAAYAGNSFATPDLLGTLQYGTPLMHVTADRTQRHGLASVGYDDDAVAAQRWDLVRRRARRLPARPGVRAAAGARPIQRLLVRRLPRTTCRSSGWRTCRAAGPRSDPSTADLIPCRRTGSTSSATRAGRSHAALQLPVHRPAVFRIRNGRLDGQLRDVAYQATTTDFWGRWRRSVARRRGGSAARSTAARRNPGRSRR